MFGTFARLLILDIVNKKIFNAIKKVKRYRKVNLSVFNFQVPKFQMKI